VVWFCFVSSASTKLWAAVLLGPTRWPPYRRRRTATRKLGKRSSRPSAHIVTPWRSLRVTSTVCLSIRILWNKPFVSLRSFSISFFPSLASCLRIRGDRSASNILKLGLWHRERERERETHTVFVKDFGGCETNFLILGDGQFCGVGPNLHGLFGMTSGTTRGFTYSTAYKNKDVFVWTEEHIYDYLLNPKKVR